jgi:5-methylcytosine-specific restriction endonuclease McrA
VTLKSASNTYQRTLTELLRARRRYNRDFYPETISGDRALLLGAEACWFTQNALGSLAAMALADVARLAQPLKARNTWKLIPIRHPRDIERFRRKEYILLVKLILHHLCLNGVVVYPYFTLPSEPDKEAIVETGTTFDTLCMINRFAISGERMYTNKGADTIMRSWDQGKRLADYLMNLTRELQPLYYAEEHFGNQRPPPRNWNTIRDFLTDLQDRLCDICGENLTDDKQCDHIFPRNAGGTYVITNLRMTHRDCNRWKSDRTAGEGDPEANLLANFDSLLPGGWVPGYYRGPLLSLSLNHGQAAKAINRTQRLALSLARSW